jgi:hypothetical protein
MRHRIRQGAAVGAVVIGLVSLTACGRGGDRPAQAYTEQGKASSTTGSSPSRSPVPASTPTVTAGGSEEGAAPEPLASPVNDAASSASALDLATKAMTAFARPQVPAQRWWRELWPLLSDTARAAYTGTDPANVPAHGVTGAGTLLPTTTGYLVSVRLPTDVGSWTVLLKRPGQNAPWAVERFTPPAGIH